MILRIKIAFPVTLKTSEHSSIGHLPQSKNAKMTINSSHFALKQAVPKVLHAKQRIPTSIFFPFTAQNEAGFQLLALQ